ncbi:Tr-type G domain-containing protein [Aphelenchoides besseyi]|nr:Tr-type G domain-containing protein [Aphelenchoides besseyi]KAI6199864.1 Tr-type G domain-containing protein [Aphelenchoides besseyi]
MKRLKFCVLSRTPAKYWSIVQRQLRSTTTVDAANIRNVGIIAHIDAGKTTVTERLLYLTGRTKTIGDVDDGNTVTDFMEMERDRGITIQSAAVSSIYKGKRINLIDTPGHVDFTVEVERALRVLDGAITVLDGSAGVQAQTLTVWRQASKYQLSNVFFVNKMDKFNANFLKSLQSIENKLHTSVAPIVIPIQKANENSAIGFLDLINGSFLMIGEETEKWKSVEPKTENFDLLLAGREDLYEKVAEHDDKFADLFLRCSNYADLDIREVIPGLKRCVLNRSLSPVACGSALRCTNSVISVLDMITEFLPSPHQRHYDIPSEVQDCGFIFKVAHDKRMGSMYFVRMYKGVLDSTNSFVTSNSNGIKRSNSQLKLFTPFSDELEPAALVEAGNIAVVSGLVDAVTGDTILNARYAEKSDEAWHLDGIDVPDPVFYCSIEPPNVGAAVRMDKALAEIVKEDPSFRVRLDAESGQTVVETMGELHAEVLKHRLKHDYNLDVFLGPLQISYREVIEHPTQYTSTIKDQFEENRVQSCTLTLQIEPAENLAVKFKTVTRLAVIVSLENEDTPPVRREWLKAINEGCKNSLFNGPVLNCPVQGVVVKLTDFAVSGGRISSALLSACASDALSKALRNAGAYLIEPLMMIEIELHHDHESTVISSSTILHELTKRRATILDSQTEDLKSHALRIRATVPLAETQGIARAIRSASSGYASFHMEICDYDRVPANKVAELSAHSRRI